MRRFILGQVDGVAEFPFDNGFSLQLSLDLWGTVSL